jgi:hypothetical protein
MGYLKRRFLLLLFLFSPSILYAAPHYGATFSYAAIGLEPPTIRGYQLMLSYDPQRFQWRKFNIYFDGGFSHFWITRTPYYTNLNIYSIAPVVRYTFKQDSAFSPYLELSIGLAYLNHTHLDSRNLGIHFAFQDRAGIGVSFGTTQQFSIGVHAVHYSNAHLSSRNSGITIPLDIDIGFRFG